MKRLETAIFSPENIAEQAKSKTVLFVFASGYEQRCLDLFRKIRHADPEDCIQFKCYGFRSFKEWGHRPANDSSIQNAGLAITEVDASDSRFIVTDLEATVSELRRGGSEVVIHIDYSSMSRNWYTALLNRAFHEDVWPTVYAWYVRGKYDSNEYPCVGYGNFSVFDGAPRVAMTREVAIFGIGFDSIRTFGIWNYLDPQNTITILAETPENETELLRARQENREVIAASLETQVVPMNDFHKMISNLVSLVRKHWDTADVALVPDGPKPLVVAMSLIPSFFGHKGVYCWHVGHVKPDDYKPSDAVSIGVVYGFCIQDNHAS